MKKHKYKDNLTAFTFLLPTNVIFITLVVVPILFSAFLSFTDWNFLSGLSGIKWVGLSNFKKLLADRTFSLWSAEVAAVTASPLGRAHGTLQPVWMKV